MKSIETLSQILKFFGWLSIILGLLFLVQAIFTHTLSLWLSLSSISRFLSGLVFLGLAYGLSKKEKWAWYTGFFVFGFVLLFALIETLFLKPSFTSIVSIGIAVLLLFLLINGKRIFIEQPKERIFQWFHKPLFIIVVVGTLLSYFIVLAALLNWWAAEEEIKIPEEKIIEETTREDKTADWKIYRNEEYGFEVKYPENWQVEISTTKSIIIKELTSSSYLEIIENNNEKSLTLDEWFQESTMINGRPTLKASAQPTFINDVKAHRIDSELEPPNPLFEIVGIANTKKRIFTIYAYSGDLNDNTILEQMLSTFSFLE